MISRIVTLGLASALVVALGAAAPATAAQVESLEPSDRLTVADPGQITGRRVALPLPDCTADPSGCEETRLLNELDGASVNPRIALRFSRPIAVDSVTPATAFVVPLSPEPLASPVGLVQLVWHAEHRTLYARPARVLLQNRRYAIVVTTRVKDDRGRGLRPGRLAPTGDAAKLVTERLGALGVAARDVAAADVFTTMSVTAGLERMREAIDTAPASAIGFALAADGGRSVYGRADVTALEFRRQVLASPAHPLAESVKLPLTVVPPTEVGAIAFGSFRARSFLSPERHVPAWPTRSGAPQAMGTEDIGVTVFLPAGPMPEGGWPVAIFGHGFGNDRHAIPILVAGTMARHGIATVAINAVGHGGGPAGQVVVFRDGHEPVMLPAGGRGADLDGDGRIGGTEGIGTVNRGPLALIATRDGLRQTVADLIQLVRAISAGVDVDGDGRVDLDRERIHYFGQSFGGIYGTLLMAVDPLVSTGVLNVPGGPISEVARLTPIFRGLAVEQLRRRRPPLMNGDRNFDESIPLYGEPPVLRPAQGAMALQAYFDRAEWLSHASNPVAFAPYLRAAPLAGLAPKAVLYQMAVGDRTVPNPTTENIVRAGDLRAALSVYRHDLVIDAMPDRFKNPHGFLTWTQLGEGAAIARSAQEQIARFFLSGGRVVEPLEGPSPPRQ
jgi:hypothetical protein